MPQLYSVKLAFKYRALAKPLTDLRVRMTEEVLKFIRLIKVRKLILSALGRTAAAARVSHPPLPVSLPFPFSRTSRRTRGKSPLASRFTPRDAQSSGSLQSPA